MIFGIFVRNTPLLRPAPCIARRTEAARDLATRNAGELAGAPLRRRLADVVDARSALLTGVPEARYRLGGNNLSDEKQRHLTRAVQASPIAGCAEIHLYSDVVPALRAPNRVGQMHALLRCGSAGCIVVLPRRRLEQGTSLFMGGGLPTPSTRRLDGVEGDLCLRHSVHFRASHRGLFLVSIGVTLTAFVELLACYGLVTGVLLPTW